VSHVLGFGTCILQGRNLGINSSLAIFITMNPMYEFRNVLPSNLKVSLSLMLLERGGQVL
jgi:hypothetical protein